MTDWAEEPFHLNRALPTPHPGWLPHVLPSPCFISLPQRTISLTCLLLLLVCFPQPDGKPTKTDIHGGVGRWASKARK